MAENTATKRNDKPATETETAPAAPAFELPSFEEIETEKVAVKRDTGTAGPNPYLSAVKSTKESGKTLAFVVDANDVRKHVNLIRQAGNELNLGTNVTLQSMATEKRVKVPGSKGNLPDASGATKVYFRGTARQVRK